MTSISKPQLQAIRKDVDALLLALAPKFGLSKLKLANCTYSPEGSFTFKLEGQVAGGTSKEGSRYNQHRHSEPLPPLGTEFQNRGDTFVIVGSNATGSKVLAKLKDKDDGRTYLFTPESIQRLCRAAIDLSGYQEWMIPEWMREPAKPSLLQKQAG